MKLLPTPPLPPPIGNISGIKINYHSNQKEFSWSTTDKLVVPIT
jgi:hypothetical protein